MSAVLLGSETPNTEPWYRLRAGGIGASEIAAVVGLSPYMSAFWLWHFKKGNLPAQKVNDAMDWGHRLEPVVRDWFQERHYPEVVVIGTPGTFAHADRDWQRVNPDGLIFETGDWYESATPEPIALYEGKTARYPDNWGPSGSDRIPIDYRCQIQHALDVFDLPRAYVAVLIGGNDPREYVIEADADDQRGLREAGAAFWASLQNDDEPPIDCSDSTYQAVRELHPEINGEDVELDTELHAHYLTSKSLADDWADIHRRAKSEVLAAMGEARRALVDGAPVLRRQPTGKGGIALYSVKESA